ncbi:anaerobic benzoate catabolism transcriptional regulator [Phycisphaerae bacterium RAS1]|nr:anaerobic benzoate catabolism transcriptional regulator [Phycisphaerae bacterium RAS1]
MAKKLPELQRDFGRRIRELRLRAGLTQKQLGDRCGKRYSMQRIGQVERGLTNCTLETITSLARGLRCEPIELFLFETTRSIGGVSLSDARLSDLWRALSEEKKQKLLRVLGELM